ncbi:MAG: NAD-dependent epimerase/dehydratase family protein [Ruminococcaceae bacterium]|nr:NAD-dependent epimerase/dehydratase family protein [Oscillospiraceae bacterium]
MKILITGAGSYIGMCFEEYMKNFPDYQVDTLDMLQKNWESKDFSSYDSIYHVAGIAHRKETEENANLYYEVNRDLVLKVAEKAKRENVKQFVFLSSMSVYGVEEGVITKDTPPNPKSNYGKSKIQAEELLGNLRSDDFKIAIMRPPMVYGDGCKGNYQMLVKFAKMLPVFPDYENKRSMIHVDNLSKFVKNLIDEEKDGLFFPQDENYVCTCKMVKEIGNGMGKNIKLLKIMNPAVSILKKLTTQGKKAFGDLIYDIK